MKTLEEICKIVTEVVCSIHTIASTKYYKQDEEYIGFVCDNKLVLGIKRDFYIVKTGNIDVHQLANICVLCFPCSSSIHQREHSARKLLLSDTQKLEFTMMYFS